MVGIQALKKVEQRGDVRTGALVNDVEVQRRESRPVKLGRCAANDDESHPGAVQLDEQRGSGSFVRVDHA